MKRKNNILMYGIFDAENIQAQSRDALNWALFLNDELFKITAFVQNLPDNRLENKKNVKLIRVSKNKYLRHLKMLFYLISPYYNMVLLSMPTSYVLLYLHVIDKVNIFKKKIIISLVNRLPYDTKFEKILYSEKFHQFAISKQIKEDFYYLTNRDIQVVHLVYDLSLFFPVSDFPQKERVACVGSMQIRKNPFLFSNIAKKIPECDFYWIGDGYYSKWIEEKKRHNSIENLHLIKRLNQIEIADFLRNSLIFLFPSVHEGFPNVIVEALASGLPVIAMNTYGPEAVTDGFNGYVVEDEFDMYDKLKQLLDNRQLLKHMSENAINSSVKYSGLDGIQEFENFLLSI
jgi:glycosyltransferase involved in cell wall biosynthesis